LPQNRNNNMWNNFATGYQGSAQQRLMENT